MVNKAIELQASSYKKSILKEVEISNEQILDQIREERTYSSKNRRPEIIKEDHAVNSSAVPSVRAVQ